jgi:hypothetical protein
MSPRLAVLSAVVAALVLTFAVAAWAIVAPTATVDEVTGSSIKLGSLRCGTTYNITLQTVESGTLSSAQTISQTTSACPAPPPPPAGTLWFHDGFDAPNGASNLWATANWLSGPKDPDWFTMDNLYSFPWSGRSTNVLRADQSDVNSNNTVQAFLHNPTPGKSHRVDVMADLNRWGTGAQGSWSGGPKIFMGRPEDKYETSTYSVEFNIKAGVAHIQKKTWGTSMCGKDPRAVDCGAGGTWYNLAQKTVPVAALGTWHKYSATKTDNPDGSVTLVGYVDGQEVIRFTESATPGNANYLPNSPVLRGGRDGWRFNGADVLLDSYDVTVTS